MCILRVCCCLFTVSGVRAFLLEIHIQTTENNYMRYFLTKFTDLLANTITIFMYLISISARLFASVELREIKKLRIAKYCLILRVY